MERKSEIRKLIDYFHCIIFDMDGVIINSEPIKYLAYQKTFLKHYGVFLSPDDVSWRGKPEKDVIKYWVEKLNIKDDADVASLTYYKRMIYRSLLQSGRVNLVPGVKEFLGSLNYEGKQLGLATTSNRADQQAIFKLFDLGKYFNAVTTLDDITYPKPDPEIYFKTAYSLGTRPANCIVFEDSPSGVMAARTAGMQVICVLTSYKEFNFQNCSFLINSFEEL